MSIKQYFPLSVGIFILVVAGAHYLAVPVVPFALILLVAETLIGFQLEDHKVPHALKDLFGAFKSERKSV